MEEKMTNAPFEFVKEKDKNFNKIVRPSLTYWQDVRYRYSKNKLAIAGLIFIIFITLAAIFVPIIWEFFGYNYRNQNLSNANKFPSFAHWFGTDRLGRDIFVRVMYGARYSLAVAFLGTILNFMIGIIYGGISGFAGGTMDLVMMRIVDILYSIPTMIVVILLGVVFKPGFASILIALVISYWISMARIVRGEVLQLKNQEFVLAARTLGVSNSKILFRHLIPNSMGPIIVTATLMIPQAIFLESFLSFLGLGIQAPKASWGTLASDAVQTITKYPYQLLFPALALSLTMLAFNFLGDGLRDSLDPKMRR